MSKLWRCTFNVEMVVEAESATEARLCAVDNLADAADSVSSSSVVVWEVPTPLTLPDGWKDAYPYNGDGERTCEEILRERLGLRAAPPSSEGTAEECDCNEGHGPSSDCDRCGGTGSVKP